MPFIRSSVDKLCEEMELTQWNLAKKLGVIQATIYRWLHTNHTPRLSNLDALYKLARENNLDIEFYEKPRSG